MLNFYKIMDFSASSGDKNFVLAVILESAGSTPLKVGAKMAVLRDGRTCGTVGGGRLEAVVVEKAMDMLASGARCETAGFDLSRRDSTGLGMICGGGATIGLVSLGRREAESLKKNAKTRLGEKTPSFLAVDFENAAVFFGGESKFSAWLKKLGRGDAASLPRELVRNHYLLDKKAYFENSRRPETVRIFGGGHIALHLSKITSLIGFETAVYDNREEFARPERFSGYASSRLVDFDAFGPEDIDFDPSDYCVIVTHGHRHDRQVLKKLLEFGAEKYLGMIGSRTKVRAIMDSLQAEGFSPERLGRVKSPIGLSIGALTAEEIAVSIAAEIISVRRAPGN